MKSLYRGFEKSSKIIDPNYVVWKSNAHPRRNKTTAVIPHSHLEFPNKLLGVSSGLSSANQLSNTPRVKRPGTL